MGAGVGPANARSNGLKKLTHLVRVLGGALRLKVAGARLGVGLHEIAHVGDSWSADYVGARNAGMRAVLFRGADLVPAGEALVRDDRGATCDTPAGLRAALAEWM